MRSAVFSRATVPSGSATGESALIAALVVVLCAALFAYSSTDFCHWFLIPISVSGLIITMDAVDWIRGRMPLLSPAGILGLYGFHFFFLAPLLHVRWNWWMTGVSPPPDWREWLGYMAILNCVGLVCYRFVRLLVGRSLPKSQQRSYWRIDEQIFWIVTPILLLVAAVCQVLVYISFGGIQGYMDAALNNSSAFEGMGWIFMISESTSVLAMFVVIIYARRVNMSWPQALLTILALFVVQLAVAGLRGSRS